MDDRSSSGRSQPIAALLRPFSGAQRQTKQHAGGVQRPKPASADMKPVRKPVLETSEFRVFEPDGTEDPWASAGDGLVPEKSTGGAGRKP